MISWTRFSVVFASANNRLDAFPEFSASLCFDGFVGVARAGIRRMKQIWMKRIWRMKHGDTKATKRIPHYSLHNREVVLNGEIKVGPREFWLDRVKEAERADLQEKIAGVAIAEWAIVRFVMLGDEVIDGFLTMGDFQGAAHDFKELSERFFRGIGYFDFVRDTSKECVVDEVFGFQVSTENHQLIEGNLDFFTATDGKVIVAFLKGDDPAIEQFIDTHSLATEVIDEQDAAIAFELQWGF